MDLPAEIAVSLPAFNAAATTTAVRTRANTGRKPRFSRVSEDFRPVTRRAVLNAFDVLRSASFNQALELNGEFYHLSRPDGPEAAIEGFGGVKLSKDKTSQGNNLCEVGLAVNQMDQVPQQNSERAGEAARATRSPVASACHRF